MSKVMLVEDDATMSSLLQTLLSIEGYQVIQVEDFANVLNEIINAAPDVVLMDVHLEGLDGIEILENIRKTDSLKSLAVIMSSGMDFSHECRTKGANAFLLKPYMPDELIDKIKQMTVQTID